MKMNIWFLCLTVLTVTPCCYYQKNNSEKHASVSRLGPVTFDHKTLLTLSVIGPCTASNIKVVNDATIVGPVYAKMCTFNDLYVTGTLDVISTNCSTLKVTGTINAKALTVSGLSTIVGVAEFDQSNLQNLIVTAENVSVKNSTTNNIHIKENNPGTTLLGYKRKSKEQVLILEGATHITGSITFDAGNGKIIIKGKNVKIDGIVKGATTEYE